MMTDVRINYLAVLVAAIVYFALGAAWYAVFAQPWLALTGIGDAHIKANSSLVLYAVAFIAGLAVCYALAHVVARFGSDSPGSGAMTGFFLGVAFVLTTTLANYEFEFRPTALALIDAGYPIVGMIAAGAILAAWPVRRSPA